MSFVEAVQSVYRNYAKFSGRATRHEFWWFILFYVAVSIAIAVFMVAAGSTMYTIGALALGVFSIGTLIPYLAVAVRRLHDTNRSGWWLLISIIPFGSLVLLVMLALPGTPGPNNYGPDPRMAVGYA